MYVVIETNVKITLPITLCLCQLPGGSENSKAAMPYWGGAAIRSTTSMLREVSRAAHTWHPFTMDWKPEPHSLLTVRAPISVGTPTRKPTCLAKYNASEEVWTRKRSRFIRKIVTTIKKDMEMLVISKLYGSGEKGYMHTETIYVILINTII